MDALLVVIIASNYTVPRSNIGCLEKFPSPYSSHSRRFLSSDFKISRLKFFPV